MIPQRFGPTSAFGLNFPLFDALLTKQGWRVSSPSGDESRTIHTRLLSLRDLAATRQALENRLGNAATAYLETPLVEARACVVAGRKQEALEHYQVALGRQPRNWQIIGEAAEFVGLQLREFAAGIELARAALELNSRYSAWLWNVLGDCLYSLGRVSDAHEAYLLAESIDDGDVRGLLNLAFTYHHIGRLDLALHAVARGLLHDTRGQFRERLLDRQQQIVLSVGERAKGEYDRLLRRAARFQQAAAE